MSQSNSLISVIDDDPSMSRMLCRAIKAAGLRVDAFGSAEEFLVSEASRASDCLILDMNLPGISGLELQLLLNLKAGAVGFLREPFSIESLLATLR